MDKNLAHDVKLINKELDEIKKSLDDAIKKYAAETIDTNYFKEILFQRLIDLNGLSSHNAHVFINDKNSSLRLGKLYTKLFKYINHHEKIINFETHTNNDIKV